LAYLTVDQLKGRVGGDERFLKLTDDDEDGQPDTRVTTALLAGVDKEADAYFRAGGYTIPLGAALLEGVSNALLDIANYRAKTRGDRQASEDDRLAYQDALARLRLVADRKILLAGSDDTQDVQALGEYVLDSDEQFFSRDNLRGL
jgi:phage gp36-like protein